MTAPDLTPPVDSNAESLAIAYEEARAALERVDASWDALDEKAATLFGATAIVTAVVPATSALPEGGPGLIAWVVAVGSWLVGTYWCYRAYRPRDLAVDLIPSNLVTKRPELLRGTADEYRRLRFRRVARTFEANAQVLAEKGRALVVAGLLAVIEVLSLAVAFFFNG